MDVISNNIANVNTTRGPDGKVLHGRAGLAPGDALTVTLRDGDLRTRIEEIVETKNK